MATHYGKTARPSRITIPAGTNGLVQIAFAEARRRCRTYDDVEFDSGVLRSTVKSWRKPTTIPRFLSLEAVLGALGWEFAALPSVDTLPAALRRDLEAVLAKHTAAFPALDHLSKVPSTPVN